MVRATSAEFRDATGAGACDEVLQFRSLCDFDAGEVEHAHAFARWAEHRCPSATVDRGVAVEMFAAMQPHRAAFGQRGADGRGADAALR